MQAGDWIMKAKINFIIMTKKCKLHCDASVNRVGAVLLHAYPNGSERSIASASRSHGQA